MVTYQGGSHSWGGKTPDPVWGWGWAGLDATPLPLQSKLDRHGSGTDSDYDNTQAGEVLMR